MTPKEMVEILYELPCKECIKDISCVQGSASHLRFYETLSRLVGMLEGRVYMRGDLGSYIAKNAIRANVVKNLVYCANEKCNSGMGVPLAYKKGEESPICVSHTKIIYRVLNRCNQIMSRTSAEEERFDEVVGELGRLSYSCKELKRIKAAIEKGIPELKNIESGWEKLRQTTKVANHLTTEARQKFQRQ